MDVGSRACLWIHGARQNTLKNIDVPFPLGGLIAVTGPSGSGKSSLIQDVLHPALSRKLHRAQVRPGAHRGIAGLELIDKVVSVDQSPLGASPASNPATYTGVFELIRQLFAKIPGAKVRGFTARQFSFNVAGGRCEACEGVGQIRVQMHFLPDVWVRCEACQGRRYTEETLAVRFHGHSIHDVLEMPIGSALTLMENLPQIRRVLQTLVDVGLGYLKLGQSAPTLSGGEAQRIKLAAELSRPNTGKTIYLLDEPTTGLHFEDISKLLSVMHRLVDLGNTMVIVEHNLDVVKSCDWVIDLGPEAGQEGGYVVTSGTPEWVVGYAQSALSHPGPDRPRSYTGEALAPVLAAGPRQKRAVFDPLAEKAPRADDMSLAQYGKKAKAPWESNGRKWHLETSVDRTGKPPRWDRRILREIVARIERDGRFAPVGWNSNSIVSVESPHTGLGWFLHAITAETWIIKLKIRIPKGHWTKAELLKQFRLPSLNELEDVPAFHRQERCMVSVGKDWLELELRPHRFKELEEIGFWDWLALAMDAYASLPPN
jgi:excinuclease ABC subunit A